MVERRQHPDESDSLDLLAVNSHQSLALLMDIHGKQEKLIERVSGINEHVEEMRVCQRQQMERGAEVARRLDEHLEDIEPWKMLWTQLEADNAKRKARMEIIKDVTFTITKSAAIVTFVGWLVLNADDMWQHLKRYY